MNKLHNGAFCVNMKFLSYQTELFRCMEEQLLENIQYYTVNNLTGSEHGFGYHKHWLCFKFKYESNTFKDQ